VSEGLGTTAPTGLISMRLLAETVQGNDLIEPWERAAANLPQGALSAPIRMLPHLQTATYWAPSGTVSLGEAVTTTPTALFSNTTRVIESQSSGWIAAWLHSVPQSGTSAKAGTLQQFRRRLDGWRGLLTPRHYDAMGAHIERLLGDEDELKEEGITPSIGSLDDLLMFLASRHWTKPPAIGLDRQGCFALSWAPARQVKADLTLTFLGNGSVRWYVYDARDRARPASSATGVSRRDEMPAILAAFGCDAWAAA